MPDDQNLPFPEQPSLSEETAYQIKMIRRRGKIDDLFNPSGYPECENLEDPAMCEEQGIKPEGALSPEDMPPGFLTEDVVIDMQLFKTMSDQDFESAIQVIESLRKGELNLLELSPDKEIPENIANAIKLFGVERIIQEYLSIIPSEEECGAILAAQEVYDNTQSMPLENEKKTTLLKSQLRRKRLTEQTQGSLPEGVDHNGLS